MHPRRAAYMRRMGRRVWWTLISPGTFVQLGVCLMMSHTPLGFIQTFLVQESAYVFVMLTLCYKLFNRRESKILEEKVRVAENFRLAMLEDEALARRREMEMWDDRYHQWARDSRDKFGV